MSHGNTPAVSVRVSGQQPPQHCLGQVVGLMRRKNDGPPLFGQPREDHLALLAGDLFPGTGAFRGGWLKLKGQAFHPEPSGEPLDKALIFVGLPAPPAMVDVKEALI